MEEEEEAVEGEEVEASVEEEVDVEVSGEVEAEVSGEVEEEEVEDVDLVEEAGAVVVEEEDFNATNSGRDRYILKMYWVDELYKNISVKKYLCIATAVTWRNFLG